ncbi:MAG: DMT family transporter [Bdellovibrio sp.]|nr:DMT family transporter [Bdellovibrio sp.]
MLAILFALGSNFAFAIASVFFTEFSRKISPNWVNYLKATVAFICFVLVILLFSIDLSIAQRSLVLLIVSGITGLMIGDIFLFRAFAHLGAGRVLMIFGFQPLLIGIASYYLFDTVFSPYQLIALFFLIGCIFCFSLESFREKGHWDSVGIAFAITGVVLDAAGLLMTKQAFELTPNLSPFVANAIRSGATVVGFFLVSLVPMFHLKLLPPFKTLTLRQRWLAIFSGFLGTFVALGFYLKAIQLGNLPVITAIAGTSPLFATLFEIYRGRKKMTAYLAAAILFFLVGFAILITS